MFRASHQCNCVGLLGSIACTLVHGSDKSLRPDEHSEAFRTIANARVTHEQREEERRESGI